MSEPPAGGTLARVGRFRRKKKAHEYGLALLARGIPYWLFEDEGRVCLLVAAEQAESARKEMMLYRRESKTWPPRPFMPDWKKDSFLPAVFYGLILSSFYTASQWQPELRELGILSARRLIEAGEWWRPITALTLHANAGHLLGNLFFGCYFGYFLTRYLGGGLGWFLVLLSGMLGNAANAWFYYPHDHRSLGASTAVLGAVGLLTGFPWGKARGFRSFWEARKTLIPPLAGGLLLLVFLGVSRPPVDVFAHLWGFLAGLLTGFITGKIKRLDDLSPAWQGFLMAASLLLIAAAWQASVP